MDALRRAVETHLQCGAAIWLVNAKTGEPYEWDRCNRDPGHAGRHEVYSDRDSDVWATWADDDAPTSRYLDLAGAFHHTEPSPWSAEELAELQIASR